MIAVTPLLDTPRTDLKPPLKWAGGKRWLVPLLKELWEENSQRRLVEPFCGGLSVALGLLPHTALLNDINPHAINFYRQLSQGMVATIPFGNSEEVYYVYRRRFNELIQNGAWENQEAAELFYYLNRTGFNGLCRFNRQGAYNVPYGKYKQIGYQTDFTPYRAVLANWRFAIGDFEALPVETTDFIYADPPYDVDFTQYAKEDFTWDDQVRLAHWLVRHPGPVALSNQATPRIVALYEDLGFQLRFLEAPRRISCNGDRTPAREVLALRNLGA